MVEVATKPSSAPLGFRPTMRLGTASVGPRSWQDDTIKTLNLGSGINGKSEKCRMYGRQHDTLPILRDTLLRQSSTVAFGYVREVRVVVVKLRDDLISTNEELKLLIRSKEATEKMLDYLRKDLIVNDKCVQMRNTRPKREKEFDEADKYLLNEKRDLENHKRNLEHILKNTKKQLIYLDASRKRLAKVLDERNQVLDLLCHAKNSTKYDFLVRSPSLSPHMSRPNTVTGLRTPKLDNAGINDLLSKTAVVSDELKRELLACELDNRPEMNRAGLYTARTFRGDTERPKTPPISNIGPFTPEAAAAIDESQKLTNDSRQLRKNIIDAINTAVRDEKLSHNAVNDALTQRLAETITLLQHLNMGEAENRNSFNRNVRHHEMTDISRGYLMGPTSYRDLKTNEHLDRPVMKIYQRHPATNVPDARDMIRGNNNLEASIEKTQKNLAHLHQSNLRIKDDIRDKKTAADIDASVIRFRRKKSDHRWVPGES